MSALVVLFTLLVLLALGVPVAFTMLASGAIGLYMIGGLPLLSGLLETTVLSTVSSYELITIPMFLLMAEFVLASGVADDLFRAATAWVGRMRGGLGMATALAGAGFAAICGTSTAAAATLASTSLPAMIKHGYDPKVAAGVVAISGTLAMLIPPSVALVIYGLIAEVSIAKLLIAGVIPGLFVMLAIMTTVWFLVWLDPSSAPVAPVSTWRERFLLLRGVSPMIALFLGVSLSIYTGLATPTETSALGAIGGFLVMAWRGKATGRAIFQSLLRAAQSTCMITAILVGAHLFGYFFTLTQVTQNLVAFVGELPFPPLAVMALILVGYLLLGTFMDQMAILVLTTPVVLPVVFMLGYDPVWFGVIMIVTAEVGMVTPPVGMNSFIVARYAQRPVMEVFHGITPHFFAHLIVISVLLLVPEIVLWLPSQIR